MGEHRQRLVRDTGGGCYVDRAIRAQARGEPVLKTAQCFDLKRLFGVHQAFPANCVSYQRYRMQKSALGSTFRSASPYTSLARVSKGTGWPTLSPSCVAR